MDRREAEAGVGAADEKIYLSSPNCWKPMLYVVLFSEVKSGKIFL